MSRSWSLRGDVIALGMTVRIAQSWISVDVSLFGFE
jgi:hypothetical protein